MIFKRLNNMTGMDKVLNKRIASIFLNEFESLKNDIKTLPDSLSGDSIKFSIHKIRPSMIIFELDSLLNKYETLAARKKAGDNIDEKDPELTEAIQETETKIDLIRAFIQSI